MRLGICRFAIPASLAIAAALPSHADEIPAIDIVQAGGFTTLVPACSHSITARLRQLSLSSGKMWVVDLYGDRLINFQLDNSAVPNGLPDGSRIDLSSKDAERILASAVNLDGIAIAAASHIESTAIVLNATQNPSQHLVSVAVRTHPHLSMILKQFQARMARNRRLPTPGMMPSTGMMPPPTAMAHSPGSMPPPMPRPTKAG